MKQSSYNYIMHKGVCSLIYNCRTEAVSAIDNKLAEALESGNIEMIEHAHPDFYAFLVQSGFLVPDDIVEYQSVIDAWKQEDETPAWSVFINPTLDCNLRCWYCYEEHLKGSMMSAGVMQSVLSLVRELISQKNIRLLNLSFFGGEPLLGFNKVILPLLRQLVSLCKEHGVMLNVGFVTNATLLTKKNIEALKSLCISGHYSFQITLDGNEEYHNKTKHFPTNDGSYQLVLDHILQVVQENMDLLLRFNMSAENIDSYYDVLSDLCQIPKEDRKKFSIDFQHVWQDNNISVHELLKRQEALRTAFLAEGFQVKELKNIDSYRCYADRKNHVTINYNGDLFMCTARDFKPESREGVLLKDGRLKWNEKHALRDSIRFGNDTCHKCRIFPLCHGGCSQSKLDAIRQDGDDTTETACLRHYSESDINEIFEKRIDYILERLG